jgi:excisionase family DNA binding protein
MKRPERDDAEFLSVDQVAERLGLHVRTVRRYVRHGRLRAVRIGKQYRVAREALDTLTGRVTAPAAVASPAPAARHVQVSAIVDADGVDADTASRVTNAVLAAVKRPDREDPLRIDSLYDPERARLKVILHGSAATTASLLKFINAYLEA